MGQELFQHGNLEAGYIHRITNWRFVDTASRMDPSNLFTFRDIDKVAYDAETEKYYVLHKVLAGFIPEWQLVSAIDAVGEANTLYKVGAGVALNGPKVGTTLGIRSIAGTANKITVTELGDGSVAISVADNLSVPFINITGMPSYLPSSYVPPLATGGSDGTITAADFTKLTNIQANATANSSDTFLRNRTNHTGTQDAASTLTGLAEAVQDIVGAAFTNGDSITFVYDDALGSFKVNYTPATGTFIPVPEGLTTPGTFTPVVNSGKYTRLGDGVAFTLSLEWTGHDGTGDLIISGLPFLAGSFDVSLQTSFDLLTAGAGKQLSARILAGTDVIVLEACDVAGGARTPIPVIAAVDNLTISGIYFT